MSDLGHSVETTIRSCTSRLSVELEQIFADLNRTDTAGTDDPRMRELQQNWERRIDSASDETREVLEALRDQLQSLTAAVSREEMLDATTAAIETRAEAYREQLDLYIGLAQLDMALGILQHEFGNAVGRIRSAIRKLKPWADETPELATVYRALCDGFDQLDAYLKLFAPLSRRLNSEPIDLSGEEIRRYLTDVFSERLARDQIRVVATAAFDRKSVHGNASTFLPAFVNLVENAIYWLGQDRTKADRLIKLDADDAGFLISNTGPGIDRRIADRVFEFGETTKPGGRGMGLYFSREALCREGYDLTLEASGAEVPPLFRIVPREHGQSLENIQ